MNLCTKKVLAVRKNTSCAQENTALNKLGVREGNCIISSNPFSISLNTARRCNYNACLISSPPPPFSSMPFVLILQFKVCPVCVLCALTDVTTIRHQAEAFLGAEGASKRSRIPFVLVLEVQHVTTSCCLFASSSDTRCFGRAKVYSH
jgi:hypothetical protein